MKGEIFWRSSKTVGSVNLKNQQTLTFKDMVTESIIMLSIFVPVLTGSCILSMG